MNQASDTENDVAVSSCRRTSYPSGIVTHSGNGMANLSAVAHVTSRNQPRRLAVS